VIKGDSLEDIGYSKVWRIKKSVQGVIEIR